MSAGDKYITCPKCKKVYCGIGFTSCPNCHYNQFMPISYKKNNEHSSYNDNIIESKQKYSVSPEKPANLPPGSTPPPLNLTINSEPLSTKQLYEIITSKNITIDATFTRIYELMNTLKHVHKLLKVEHYDQAMKILDKIIEIR